MADEANTNATETKNMAENSGGDPKGDADKADAVSTPETEQAEKTFTQKELDEIVKQRLDRAKKDMPSKDELKAFREWKDSQKTAEQKAAEQLAEVAAARDTAEREKSRLEIKVSCLSKGVPADAADDVIALAERFIDDDTTIEKAVEKVLEKYPSFRSAVKVPGITTGTKTIVSEKSPVSCGFFDIARDNQVKRK